MTNRQIRKSLLPSLPNGVRRSTRVVATVAMRVDVENGDALILVDNNIAEDEVVRFYNVVLAATPSQSDSFTPNFIIVSA
jgi:hypothetical protein